MEAAPNLLKKLCASLRLVLLLISFLLKLIIMLMLLYAF